jgi:protein required for attachment to host cells
MEPDTELKRAELRRFVHRLASELDAAALTDSFDQLVIVAADRVLGEMRSALSPRVASRISQQIEKDLAGLDDAQLAERLAPVLWP